MERHPGIAFRGKEGSRRAWVAGTALDVWEIVAAYEEMDRKRVLEVDQRSESPRRLFFCIGKPNTENTRSYRTRDGSVLIPLS